ERVRIGLAADPAQIRRVVLDAAGSLDPQFAKSNTPGERRAEPMPRFVAMRAEGDVAVILDPRFKIRDEAHPRLRGEQHAWRADAARTYLLGEQGIDGMEGVQAEQLDLFLHQRPEGEGARIALEGGVLV